MQHSTFVGGGGWGIVLAIFDTKILSRGNFGVGTRMQKFPNSSTFRHVADMLPTCRLHSQLRRWESNCHLIFPDIAHFFITEAGNAFAAIGNIHESDSHILKQNQSKDWYTGEHVVTLLAEHIILLPGGRLHINFHLCVLHLQNIHTISALQNLVGIHSICTPLSSATRSFQLVSWWLQEQELLRQQQRQCQHLMRMRKRGESAARTRQCRKTQSEEQQGEIRQAIWTEHAEGRTCLSEEQQSEIRQTNRTEHAEGRARLSAEGAPCREVCTSWYGHDPWVKGFMWQLSP